VQSVQGTKGVSVQGSEGFQPILAEDLEYPELPDDGDPIDFPAVDTPLTEFLSVVSDVAGWNIIVSEEIASDVQITFWFHGVKASQAMKILRFAGIYYSFDEETKTLSVMTVEEHQMREHGALAHDTFMVRDADSTDMEAILTSLMSPAGKLISDPRTGSIMVWDTRANLDAMRKALAKLDVPLESKAFPLMYVQADDMLESVENILTERGSAQADPRTNTIIVTDLPARQKQIAAMIQSLDHKLDTRTWVLNYIEPETAQERLESIIPEDAGIFSADEDSHQLSMTALPERLAEADELIKMWDVQPAQVQIEAYLVTASTSVTRNFGIDWTYFDEISGTPISLFNGGTTDAHTLPATGQRFSVGRLPYQVPLRNPWTSDPIRDHEGEVILDPEFKGNRIAAVIDYLDQTGDLTILSRPRITVRDGMEASFENTDEIPYQNTAYSAYGGNNNNTGNNFSPYVIPTSIQKEKVGTILKVQPRITDDGTITMQIEAEDSTAEIVTIVSGGQPSTVPQVRKSSAKTEVLVNNGQTIVLGGLRSGTVQDDVDRVPVLGDMPLFGKLFRNTKKKREDRDLLVFLTPTVVSGYTPKEAERLANIDAAVAEKLRDSLKPFMERLNSELSGGKNEAVVAIGDSGSIHFDGQLMTLEQLNEALGKIEKPAGVKLVIRPHPNAPDGLAESIAAKGSELGMKVVRDENTSPFVPTPAPGTTPQELVTPEASPAPGPAVAPISVAPIAVEPPPKSDVEVTPLPDSAP
jgi:general secretion pathway protein D